MDIWPETPITSTLFLLLKYVENSIDDPMQRIVKIHHIEVM